MRMSVKHVDDHLFTSQREGPGLPSVRCIDEEYVLYGESF